MSEETWQTDHAYVAAAASLLSNFAQLSRALETVEREMWALTMTEMLRGGHWLRVCY